MLTATLVRFMLLGAMVSLAVAGSAIATRSAPRATILYVDDDAPALPQADGHTWKGAFPTLQDALERARESGPNVREIRIAGGTYRADQGANVTPGDRLATLHLVSGVDLKGGYRGAYAPGTGSVPHTSAGLDADHRDTEAYETRLTGDVLGDDGPPPNYANYGENTINILTIADARITLDGLTIRNSGLDYDATPESAAIICEQSRLTLRDCRLLYNKGTYWAGAVRAETSEIQVERCNFTGKFALSRSRPSGR